MRGEGPVHVPRVESLIRGDEGGSASNWEVGLDRNLSKGTEFWVERYPGRVSGGEPFISGRRHD